MWLWLWWWSPSLPPSIAPGHGCVEEMVNAAVSAAVARATGTGGSASSDSDDDIEINVNIDNSDVQGQSQSQEATGGISESDDEGGQDMLTICHRPPGGGPSQTLTLPIQAAIAHLENHPDDTIGACPVMPSKPVVETPVEPDPDPVVEPTPEPVVEEPPIPEPVVELTPEPEPEV